MNVLQKTMVIGAGQMGCGIAQTLIQSGGEVTLYDIKHAAVNRGMSLIEESLKRLVDKEKLTKEQREQFLAKLTPTISLKNAESVDLVIEAAPEQMEIKKSLFKNWIAYARQIRFWQPIPRPYPLRTLLLQHRGRGSSSACTL